MPSAISYEYYSSQKGVANGFATLDSNTKVPLTQLPATVQPFKGTYATSSALTTAYPTGATGDYAYVTGDNAYYYWNSALTTPAWVNQLISATAYSALTAVQKGVVPYIVNS